MATNVKFGAIALDCPDPWALAQFYGRLLDWKTKEGEGPDDRWVTLENPDGGPDICFQRDPDFRPSTWPSNERAQMLHIDFDVPDIDAEQPRVLALGAKLLDDEPKGFRVYADPAGHPFRICLE